MHTEKPMACDLFDAMRLQYKTQKQNKNLLDLFHTVQKPKNIDWTRSDTSYLLHCNQVLSAAT